MKMDNEIQLINIDTFCKELTPIDIRSLSVHYLDICVKSEIEKFSRYNKIYCPFDTFENYSKALEEWLNHRRQIIKHGPSPFKVYEYEKSNPSLITI
jgi:hypothetical protein